MEGLQIRTLEELMGEGGVEVAPGQLLQVRVGDKVRVKASLEYMGTALSDYFYAAIGNAGAFGFDEILNAQVPVSFAQSATWQTYQLSVDIPITSAISPGKTYSLYCKIKGHLEAGQPEVDNVIEVLAPAQFQNFQIVSYEKV